MANGSTTHLDLMACELKRLNADHSKNVKWESTHPNTWLLEADKGPTIINDSFVAWGHSLESLSVRTEWLKAGGKLFPNTAEAIVVLEVARATVDDEAGSCPLTETVLEWYQSKAPVLLPTAIGNLQKLMVVYQKGSMLHDSIQVLGSFLHDYA